MKTRINEKIYMSEIKEKITGAKRMISTSKRTKIIKTVKNCILNLVPAPDKHQKPLSKGSKLSPLLIEFC